MNNALRQELDILEADGLRRSLRPLASAQCG